MAESKLGKSLRAARASKNPPLDEGITDPSIKSNASQGKEQKISVRVPTAAMKKHWQIKAIQEDTSISEAVIKALTERWGLPDES